MGFSIGRICDIRTIDASDCTWSSFPSLFREYQAPTPVIRLKSKKVLTFLDFALRLSYA